MRGSKAIVAAALVLFGTSQLGAQQVRPSLQNSFPLGTSGQAQCRVQSSGVDPAVGTMFDRAYAIVCRDAARPVGRIYALRKSGEDPQGRLERLRAQLASCRGNASSVDLDELSGVSRAECRLNDADVRYLVYAHERGRTLYVAEGLAGYDSALRLGLRTIVADRMVPGEVEIASTGVGDPVAFARVQAGSLDAAQVLQEGYRRNNSGNYAEAAEFFEALLQRSQGSGESRRELGEFLINRALQKSNLGAYDEADVLFAQADALPTSDPVQLRLRRNFRALHLMNQRKFAEAQALLERPLQGPPVRNGQALARAAITAATADAINSADPLAQQLSGRVAALTPEERSAILDDQSLLLRGTIDRIGGRSDLASAHISTALADLLSIRGGRVTSIARLRSQGMNELALIAEERGDYDQADRMLRQSVDVLAIEYPGSVATASATARLASYLARRGRSDEAIELYRGIVARSSEGVLGGSLSSDILAPYFDLLARTAADRPRLAADFFLAAETLARPGVASTQAVLARELSSGEDEAARLFRQAVNLSRQVEQARISLARVSAEEATPAQQEAAQLLRQELETLQREQSATQARLADFPRYRALSTQALTLQDLQSAMRPDEAYVKMSQVGGAVYTMLVTPDSASIHRSSLSARQLDETVRAIRDTLYTVQNDQVLTYPFDVAGARRLYVELLGPLAPRLASARHLIFEPAGGMLQLPPNLLIAEDPAPRAASTEIGDDFDFRGIAWLGRTHDISTAVSARAFRDMRATPPSNAPKEYLGAGQNSPVNPVAVQQAAAFRGMGGGNNDCSWPVAAWNRPISARELLAARTVIGAQGSDLLVEDEFSDFAIKQRQDLSQYRILHFATHGLVTGPRPDCPAEPALLTSFPVDPAAARQSDGLLSFREIFDLRLDADLVILSACDTAAAATSAATRAAGLSTGGDFALDGLVRAFIGAGGRSIVASHWPAPDDFGATERLIGGLFSAPPGTSTAGALRQAQLGLMDRAETSHPYYWAGFAVIGDGSRPVLRAR